MKIFRILLIFLAFLALSNCAGSPVGDALAGPEKLAQQDDAYCRSIGLQFGTNEYANCRMMQSQQRDRRHTARMAIANQALQSIQPTPTITTTCNQVGTQTMCTSH